MPNLIFGKTAVGGNYNSTHVSMVSGYVFGYNVYRMDGKGKMNYIIAEWNIDNKKEKNSSFLDIIEKFLKNIDVLVLSEVCEKHKQYIEKELLNKKQEKFSYKVKNISDKENIIMLVARDKFDKIVFCDDEKENYRISAIEVKVLTKKEKKWITFCGVRLQTQCSGLEYKNQTGCFIKKIISNRPDIVIGDYNWKSTIEKQLGKILGQTKEWKKNEEESKKIFEEVACGKKIKIPAKNLHTEQKLCELINNVCNETVCVYELQPHTSDSVLKCSAKTRNHTKYIYSNPDRVLWNKRTIEKKSIEYKPLLKGTEFPDEWPSDHRWLLFKFSVVDQFPRKETDICG